jgi:hypothetical protein
VDRADAHPLRVVPPNLSETPPRPVKSNAIKKPKEADFADSIWSAVHSDYRSGTTFGKLSETYAIPIALIVARKQRENWRRDLRQAVAAETLAALAVQELNVAPNADGVSDDELLVAAAAKRGALVVNGHRKVLADSIVSVERIVLELKQALEPRKPSAEIPVLTNVEAPTDLRDLADVAVKASSALERLVKLERLSYGLDDGNDGKPFEESLREWHAARAAERQARAGG